MSCRRRKIPTPRSSNLALVWILFKFSSVCFLLNSVEGHQRLCKISDASILSPVADPFSVSDRRSTPWLNWVPPSFRAIHHASSSSSRALKLSSSLSTAKIRHPTVAQEDSSSRIRKFLPVTVFTRSLTPFQSPQILEPIHVISGFLPFSVGVTEDLFFTLGVCSRRRATSELGQPRCWTWSLVSFWAWPINTYGEEFGPFPSLAWPRLDLLRFSFNHLIMMLRHNSLIGRGHLSRAVSTSIKGLIEYHLNNHKLLIFPTISLRSFPRFKLTILSSFPRSQQGIRVCNTIQFLSDLEGLWCPSSSFVERSTAPSSSSSMERTRLSLLASSLWCARATFGSKDFCLTSQYPTIVTIVNLLDVFVEVSLTHQELDCGILRYSLCLRVILGLSIYHATLIVSSFVLILVYPTVWLMFVLFISLWD